MTEVLRNILLVSSDKEESARIRAALVDYTVTAVTPDTAMASLRTTGFEAIVLTMLEGVCEGPSLSLLKEIFLTSPDIPIVAVVPPGEDAVQMRALRDGVASYVSRDELQSKRFHESVRFALERKHRKAKARNIESTASRHGTDWNLPLSQSDGDTYRALTADYDRLLDRSLDRQAYRGGNDSNELEAMARRLGDLKAGPRDVIDIHTAVLKRRFDPDQPTRYRALNQEARLMLLELMGYLVGYYRGAAFALKTPAPEEMQRNG